MKRKYKQARREALKSAGEYWRHVILPGHFEVSATGKYRYKARTEKHRRRKRREGRGNRPLVYTGRLRKKMLSTKPSIKLDKGGLSMVFRGLPRYTFITDTEIFLKDSGPSDDMEYLNTLHPKRKEAILKHRTQNQGVGGTRSKVVKRPNMVAELTAMNRADANAVAKVFEKALTRRLNRFDGRRGGRRRR
jgi:hypothetical protein